MDDKASNQVRIKGFYTRFTAARTDLAARLEALKATRARDDIDTLTADVAKLRKELVDATEYLPSYDQRQYEEFLKSTEQALEETRAALAPKPKFAFKRKAAKPALSQNLAPTDAVATPPTPSHVSSGSATPSSSHLHLSTRSHQYLDRSSLPTLEAASSSDLTISDLDHCLVNLLPNASAGPAYTFTALHVRNIRDSVLVLPVVNGSALLHDLTRCTIVLGCHQFRMHTSEKVDVYLSIESNPIIEHCSSVRFSAYPASVGGAGDSVGTRVFRETSKHLSVQDFSHIRATPSPNWSALAEERMPSTEMWSAVTAAGTMEKVEVDLLLTRLLPE